MNVECYIDVAQITDTSKRFLICTGNFKSNQSERVEVISNLHRDTYNTLRPLIYNKRSLSRTAEICEYCKASKVKLVWFSFFVFRFSLFVFSFSIFELSRKILFWYSKSYFDHRTESENIIFWYSKSYFDRIFRLSSNVKIGFECQNRIFRLSLNVNIGFWMSKYDFPTQFEYRI